MSANVVLIHFHCILLQKYHLWQEGKKPSPSPNITGKALLSAFIFAESGSPGIPPIPLLQKDCTLPASLPAHKALPFPDQLRCIYQISAERPLPWKPLLHAVLSCPHNPHNRTCQTPLQLSCKTVWFPQPLAQFPACSLTFVVEMSFLGWRALGSPPSPS